MGGRSRAGHWACVGLTLSICLEEPITGLLVYLCTDAPASKAAMRLPGVGQGQGLLCTPHPWAAGTHQVFHVIIIVHSRVVLLGQGQVGLVSAQDHVFPPHRVSQVKDQVLKGWGSSECAPQPLTPPLAPWGDRAVGLGSGRQTFSIFLLSAGRGQEPPPITSPR